MLWGIRMKTNEEKLAVIRAWLEKKPIEVSRIGKEWGQTNSPTWDWEVFDYRIKTMNVAKAYKREDGMLIWVVGESLLVHKYYQRLPEFDLVANP